MKSTENPWGPLHHSLELATLSNSFLNQPTVLYSRNGAFSNFAKLEIS